MALMRGDDDPDNTDYRNELDAQARELERQAAETRHANAVMFGIGTFYAIAGVVGLVALVRWAINAMGGQP